MQTTVTITPVAGTKRALCEGVPAVGETVRFVLAGLGSEIAALRLRIRVGIVDAAVFPAPDSQDEWTTSGSDAVCELSLATRELQLFSPPGTRVVATTAVIDNGTDVMLCEAPLRLLVWRKGLGPMPDPYGPANDWVARFNELSDGLDAEAGHRVAGDEALDERLDAVEGAIPNKADLENGKVPASQIPSVPPSSHASTHAAGGSDAVSPSSIGAAAATHTHTKSQITDFPASMQPTAHKNSHKTGGSDALTPSDIGAATPADATLTPSAFSPWAVSPVTYEGQTAETSVDWNEEGGVWILTVAGELYFASADHDATSFTVENVIFGTVHTVTGTRSATAYRLGPDTAANPNRDKPLAPADAIPAVVAPSTSAADAGRAADAKATGEALAGKLPATFIQVLTRYSVDANVEFLGNVLVDTLRVTGFGDLSSETWTFEVDDGQGGTETVTKSVAVFAQAAQGGA